MIDYLVWDSHGAYSTYMYVGMLVPAHLAVITRQRAA